MKNILIPTFWSFKDALIQNYTLPYLKIIQKNLPPNSKIFLITLEQPNFKMSEEEAKRIDTILQKDGIINLRYTYHRFGYKQMLMWLKIITNCLSLIRKEKIDIIHAWAATAGAPAYLISVLSGKKLYIDSYEPHAETMTESKTWSPNGLAFNILFTLEKLESRRAEVFIACVSAMKDYALKSYKIDLSNKRFFQKPACVDLSLFDLKLKKAPELLKELGLENKIVCVYAGKFGGSYLENEVFDFFKSCHNFWGEKFMVLLLSSHTETEIFNYAEKAKLPQNIFVKRFVAHADVPRYMALADFAITPFKPVPSKRYGSPVKDGEYWAMGLPVVITKDISDDSDIIEKYNIGAVLPELSEEAYQNAIQKIDFLLQTAEKENLCAKIRAIAEKYRSFEIAEKIYRQIYGEIAQKEA